MDFCYLDNAATTKPFEELQQLYTFTSTNFYNASALYNNAVNVRVKVEAARANLCKLLGGTHGNIIFTGSATEANNLALGSINYRDKKLIVFVGEHPSVYNKAMQLKQQGTNLIVAGCDNNGKFVMPPDADILQAAAISVMHVSNETGVINNIKAICGYAKKINPKIIVHVDGVQAFGKINVDVLDLGVDMYTISAHKIHGPKGIAALWVKNGVNIKPMLIGGGQESGLRSGTENVFGVLALEAAAKKVCNSLEVNFAKVQEIKTQFLTELSKQKIDYKVNGEQCSPYILNLTINGVRGEVLLHLLEAENILISTGSACSSKKPDNRTLKAMGLTDTQIKQTVRISFNAYNNVDIISVARIFAGVVSSALARLIGKR